MDPIIPISIAAGVGAVLLVCALFHIFGGLGNSRAEDRLAVITGQKTAGDASGGIMKDEFVREGMAGISGIVHKVAGRFGDLKLLFEQADSPVKAETFFLISAAAGVLVMGIATMMHCPYPAIPVFGMIGGAIPWGWIFWRRRARLKRFESQLSDALELVGRALRSGHSLASGLNVVVDEMPDPISAEFEIAYEQQNLGIPIEQALKNMLKRVPNMDLKFFVTAVAIQRQSGGDLAEILDKIGHLIRERLQILGQVKALTGEGRISGVVLMALPIVLFFMVYNINPDYVMLLFTDPVGRKLAAGAIFLQMVGAVVMKKMVDIKV